MNAVRPQPEPSGPASPAVGMVLELCRSFSQADFDRFARLSGDDNPIHVDPAYAAATRFGRTVAHGMLLYSAVEAALRRFAPGRAYFSQTLKFPNPTYAAQDARIRLEVTGLDAATGLTTILTTVVRSDGAVGLEGEAMFAPRGRPTPTVTGPTEATQTALPGASTGQWAEMRRTFSPAELAEHASLADALSLGAEPAPANVPGSLLASLFSCLLGTRLPGPGTNYLKQRLEYHHPAHPMQELTGRVEVIRVRPDKGLVNLSTLCTDSAGRLVCSGEALVLVSDVARVHELKFSQVPGGLQ